MRGRAIVQMGHTAPGIENSGPGTDFFHHPGGPEIGHHFQEPGKLGKKGVKMGFRVKQNTFCCKCRGHVGESKMDIHGLPGCQRISDLAFMKIYQGRRATCPRKGPKIRQTHHVTGDQTIIIIKCGNIFQKMERRSPHAPFPEAGGQSHQINAISRMRRQPFGKIPMGPTEKRFQKKKFHLILPSRSRM